MEKIDFVIPIVFLITLIILNIVRWLVFKFTKFKKPKYLYWYLFTISWVIAYLPIWKSLVASLN